MSSRIEIIGLTWIPEVKSGDEVAQLIIEASNRQGVAIEDRDILVVKQKIVSKAEGRTVDLKTVTPSDLASELAMNMNKDPRQVEVVLRESKRVVKMDMGLIICETRHGIVCANAGVDASNTGGDDLVTLLPEDSDLSATRILERIERDLGVDVAVIISDSMGRPWRRGIVDFAIGIAGLAPIRDYIGQVDPYGHELKVTVVAIADELASAAELVTGKLERVPVAIIKGYQYSRGGEGAKSLVIEPERDLFR